MAEQSNPNNDNTTGVEHRVVVEADHSRRSSRRKTGVIATAAAISGAVIATALPLRCDTGTGIEVKAGLKAKKLELTELVPETINCRARAGVDASTEAYLQMIAKVGINPTPWGPHPAAHKTLTSINSYTDGHVSVYTCLDGSTTDVEITGTGKNQHEDVYIDASKVQFLNLFDTAASTTTTDANTIEKLGSSIWQMLDSVSLDLPHVNDKTEAIRAALRSGSETFATNLAQTCMDKAWEVTRNRVIPDAYRLMSEKQDIPFDKVQLHWVGEPDFEAGLAPLDSAFHYRDRFTGKNTPACTVDPDAYNPVLSPAVPQNVAVNQPVIRNYASGHRG